MPYIVSQEPIPDIPQKEQFKYMMCNLEQIENMPSPRVIKSHLPLYLLHPNLLDTSKVLSSRYSLGAVLFLKCQTSHLLI